ELVKKCSGQLWYGEIRRGGTLRAEPCHALKQDRAVPDGPSHRPSLIERACEGHDAPPRAAAVGWLDPENAGDARALPDRAARVGPRHARSDSRSNRRGGSTRRPAGSQSRIAAVGRLPWADDRAIGAGLVRRAHGELVHVEL